MTDQHSADVVSQLLEPTRAHLDLWPRGDLPGDRPPCPDMLGQKG